MNCIVVLPHSNEQIKLVKLKIAKENLLYFNLFPSNMYVLTFERKQPGENSDVKR